MLLKILTLNCYGAPQSFNRKYRFQEISKAVSLLNPDIAVFQEVYFNQDHANLIKNLKNDFEIYSTDRALKTTLGGLITITKRVNTKLVGFFRFKDQGPIALFPLFDRLAPKGFQHTKVYIDEKWIDLLNIHFTCLYKETSHYLSTFGNQTRQLIKYIEESCGKYIIFAGDLNKIPNSTEITKLKEKLHLHELLGTDDFTVSSNNTNRKGLTNLYFKFRSIRTDYVLVGNNMKTLSEKVVFDQPVIVNNKKAHLSDHFGILSEIEV